VTEEQQQTLNKIRTHLAELHHKWQTDPNSDGHCKSNEGYVGIIVRYPNWFECDNDKDRYISAQPEIFIEVYSYLFGPSRLHEFSSLDAAWRAVQTWNCSSLE
jgi:hypothetical protein